MHSEHSKVYELISVVRKTASSQMPKTAKFADKQKKLVTSFSDCCGMASVPVHTMVTGQYYVTGHIQKNALSWIYPLHTYTTIIHALIQPHLPYSLMLAPCSFIRLPHLKLELQGQHFNSSKAILFFTLWLFYRYKPSVKDVSWTEKCSLCLNITENNNASRQNPQITKMLNILFSTNESILSVCSAYGCNMV